MQAPMKRMFQKTSPLPFFFLPRGFLCSLR